MRKYCINVGAVLSTIIESPLDDGRDSYSVLDADFIDYRIGQITIMPNVDTDANADIDDVLLAHYHQKTRNMVRKGSRSGFVVSHESYPSIMEDLHAIHEENLISLGGLAKPISIFEAIKSEFSYDVDYRIYVAKKDDQIAAMMLVFYFKDMVEYFTPVVRERYRSEQPLSLLIFHAMRDAVTGRSSRLWNWGGTWLSQSGVYQFKSRWGTRDFPYRYHVNKYCNSMDFSSISKADLVFDYPYFFTVPFEQLGKA